MEVHNFVIGITAVGIQLNLVSVSINKFLFHEPTQNHTGSEAGFESLRNTTASLRGFHEVNRLLAAESLVAWEGAEETIFFWYFISSYVAVMLCIQIWSMSLKKIINQNFLIKTFLGINLLYNHPI